MCPEFHLYCKNTIFVVFMKKITIAFLLVAFSLPSMAQKLDWNIHYDYLLSNYEYDRSNNIYDDSYTLHAARLSPELGFLVHQGKSVIHKVRTGIDLFKEMGEPVTLSNVFGEVLLYYNLEAKLDNGGDLEAVAGIFPRYYLEGVYIGPFFDDDLIFYDNNMEGFLVKYRNKRLYAEFGLDWMGKLGTEAEPLRRERFQALCTGLWNFAGDFNLGWAGSFYHFATSPTLPEVVDNHMFNPWVEWNPSGYFDELKLGAGVLLTYQCDRIDNMNLKTPMGFYSQQLIGKWHFFIDNHFYYGDDLMPFFSTSHFGAPYGEELYRGDLGFHTLRDHASWADYLTLRYEPRLTKWLNLELFLTFHFGEPSKELGCPVFRGWQQAIALHFNLDEIRDEFRKQKPERHYRYGIDL